MSFNIPFFGHNKNKQAEDLAGIDHGNQIAETQAAINAGATLVENAAPEQGFGLRPLTSEVVPNTPEVASREQATEDVATVAVESMVTVASAASEQPQVALISPDVQDAITAGSAAVVEASTQAPGMKPFTETSPEAAAVEAPVADKPNYQ